MRDSYTDASEIIDDDAVSHPQGTAMERRVEENLGGLHIEEHRLNEELANKCKLVQHLRVNVGENPSACSVCRTGCEQPPVSCQFAIRDSQDNTRLAAM